jgi:hypothetical protein
MLRRLARDARNLPFVLALLVALVVVPEIPSPVVRPSAGWRGRYVLLYREDAGSAVAAALAAGEREAVSRSTATVKIDAFAEIETVRVEAIDARLDPLDPRRDPWIDGVDGLFRARRGDDRLLVAYVPATRGRIAAWLRLHGFLRAAAVPRGSWRLLELEPFSTLASIVAAVIFAFAAAGRLRRSRRGIPILAAHGVAAWLPGLLAGGPGMLWPYCAAFFLWIPRAAAAPVPRDRSRTATPRDSKATGARIGAIIVVAIAALLPGDAVVYRIGRSLASLLFLELLAVAPWELLGPMPLRARRRLPASAPFAALVAAVILVALPPVLTGLRVPLPRVVSLSIGGSLEGLAAAASRGGRDATAGSPSLPGLPDAVTHARDLAVAPFVPIEGLPDPGGPALPGGEERVLLREYRFATDGSAVAEAPLTVARLDTGWLDRFLDGCREGSMERILLEQVFAVDVRLRAVWAPLLRSLPAALAVLGLIGAALVAPAARRPLIRLGLSGITEPAPRRRTR